MVDTNIKTEYPTHASLLGKIMIVACVAMGLVLGLRSIATTLIPDAAAPTRVWYDAVGLTLIALFIGHRSVFRHDRLVLLSLRLSLFLLAALIIEKYYRLVYFFFMGLMP
jgi:hypothetical protein